MCDINAVFKRRGYDCTQQLSDMSAISGVSNIDGEGAFFSNGNRIVKSKNRVPVLDHREDIKRSGVVIFHERTATSGFSENNIHPFSNERFVLFHKGILGRGGDGGNCFGGCRSYGMWNYYDDVYRFDKIGQKTRGSTDKDTGVSSKPSESDTALFFKKFVEIFGKKGDIRGAIRGALSYMGYGSYSVFIYDKIARRTYYFQNDTWGITVGLTPQGHLVFSTCRENLNFWKISTEIRPEAGKLYEIIKRKGGYEMKNNGEISRPFWKAKKEEETENEDDRPQLPAPVMEIGWAFVSIATAIGMLPFLVLEALYFFIKGLRQGMTGKHTNSEWDNAIAKTQVKNYERKE